MREKLDRPPTIAKNGSLYCTYAISILCPLDYKPKTQSKISLDHMRDVCMSALRYNAHELVSVFE